MVRTIEQIFGPLASLSSEDGVLRKETEYHHKAETIIEGMKRVHARLRELEGLQATR